jgi:flagellin
MAGNVDLTRIAGNIGALNALNSLNYVNRNLSLHQTRLATGKRLNYAYEDPAGMNLATTFDVRRQSLAVVQNAIGDSRNLLSNMDSGLTKIQEILVKMRSKTMEAIGDTIGVKERQAVQAQLEAYVQEIDQIVSQTQWNGNPLLSGSATTTLTSTNYINGAVTSGSPMTVPQLHFLVDADGGSIGFSFSALAGGSIGFYAVDLDPRLVTSASSGGSIAVSSSDMARDFTKIIDSVLDKVRNGVMDVGAFEARLIFKEDTLKIQYTNTESAYNRIMNADMASEQVEASKFSILQQTATAMLAQANVAPQFILQLFQ